MTVTVMYQAGPGAPLTMFVHEHVTSIRFDRGEWLMRVCPPAPAELSTIQYAGSVVFQLDVQGDEDLDGRGGRSGAGV